MPRVSSFMVPADDPERAASFYRNAFDWRIDADPTGHAWHMHSDEPDAPDVQGVISRREFDGQPIGIGIQVPSIDDYTARIEQQGGTVLVPKGAIPGVAWFAVCQDTEGNTFILSQPDAGA